MKATKATKATKAMKAGSYLELVPQGHLLGVTLPPVAATNVRTLAGLLLRQRDAVAQVRARPVGPPQLQPRRGRGCGLLDGDLPARA
jgi:hypothetical protein